MKAKKAPVKTAPEQPKFAPRLSDLQAFQKAYGAQWISIIRSDAFREAMFILNRSKLDALTNLSDEAIEKHSREIVGDLRGHLKHEMDLMTLHTREEGLPLGEETEEYYSPQQIAELEMMREKFRDQNRQNRYA